MADEMSDKTEKSATEEAADGLKIRKKASSDEEASAPAEETTGEQEAPAQEEEVVAGKRRPAPDTEKGYSAKSDESKVARTEGFEPAKLSRRTVDPNAKEEEEVEEASEPERRLEFEDTSASTDDFAALFEGDGPAKVPERRTFDAGERVEAPVTHIDSKYIYVDIGGRGEARASKAQYIGDEGEVEVEVGETYEFYVLRFTPDGIELGKHLDATQAGVQMFEDARASGVPMQGRVTQKNKGGFVVDISGTQAFCPVSQIDLHNADDLEVYLNETFRFRVMEVRDGGRSIVVSRAAILREEAAAAREETLAKLQPGSTVTGVIRSLTDFGAFVDLGGVDGLVHISELSWGSVDKPSDVVSEGETVEVKILDIEEREGKRPRIGLSMKQVQDDPWDRVNSELHVGKLVQGKVVRTAPFGAFVELYEGVDGLVHISELSWDHVRRVEDIVEVGETLEVEVLDIDIARQRIALSAKNAQGNPWKEAAEEYPVGAEVTGIVEKIEDFGVFVKVGEGVTALIPRSEMNLGRNETPYTKARGGQTITAKVLSVDPTEQRMALTLRDKVDADSDPRADRGGNSASTQKKASKDSSGASSSSSGSSGSFGTLGDLINLKKDDD